MPPISQSPSFVPNPSPAPIPSSPQISAHVSAAFSLLPAQIPQAPVVLSPTPSPPTISSIQLSDFPPFCRQPPPRSNGGTLSTPARNLESSALTPSTAINPLGTTPNLSLCDNVSLSPNIVNTSTQPDLAASKSRPYSPSPSSPLGPTPLEALPKDTSLEILRQIQAHVIETSNPFAILETCSFIDPIDTPLFSNLLPQNDPENLFLIKNLHGHSGHFKGKKTLLATILSVNSVVLLFFLCGYYYWWKKKKGYKMNERHGDIFNDNETEDSGKSSELQLFSFNVIVAITKNFSESNMIGKGGFGLVYKGQLPNGQEIALKRLSKNSGQGIDEFKNEVKLIAKLQHKNLVRLLGCCISGEEKILIYEYMCNKSLDSLLFDQTRSIILDWRKRFNIIVGIARGILYLHEDSRLRIIHRDLKASNILLDDDMNPKISDFGMARIFGGNQTQANTNKVVGTYGYMSPEYAMDGLFSIKSDVFSFGVWELWKEDRILELIDSSMNISTSNSEVLRCIQVGLLCVQEKAIDRPNMSSVIYMLGEERMMPLPKQPAFCFWKGYCSDHSRNEITITE
ncbi:receptor-like serine/threonine-protein kinase SD1-8 [Cinnamomum micranthum f. kanehirae]|uniref:Receptor-like serine/threonine-protein kinase SD1-8 n=1 Tax=Cinnamomum micranthum f. kanehirae TaxID=337451 RepID=A0A3S4PBH0_9MAGN|nr:receptor-like serine/threonine-protein kinase SD1-8 [Cinnamomum micranthum f. kanehirae]